MRIESLVFTAFLGACGAGGGAGGGGDGIDAGPASIDASVPVGTTGCGGGGAPGLQDRTTTVSNVSRHYQVFVPGEYDDQVPMRLIFVFHGLGGDGDLIRNYFGFEAEANGQALFVYPDGLMVQGGTGWSASDVAFFDTMVSEISAEYCVDPARVFATGHSYGGYMSNLVACARGEVLRAIAPVSGGLLTGDCDSPVAAWISHGDADGTVNQSQGIAARDLWLELDGCDATSTPTTNGCVSYDGCSDGHPVVWCSFAGGHYPLPDWTQQAIWDFFEPM